MALLADRIFSIDTFASIFVHFNPLPRHPVQTLKLPEDVVLLLSSLRHLWQPVISREASFAQNSVCALPSGLNGLQLQRYQQVTYRVLLPLSNVFSTSLETLLLAFDSALRPPLSRDDDRRSRLGNHRTLHSRRKIGQTTNRTDVAPFFL